MQGDRSLSEPINGRIGLMRFGMIVLSPFGRKTDKLQIEPIGALGLEANGSATLFLHFLTEKNGQSKRATVNLIEVQHRVCSHL